MAKRLRAMQKAESGHGRHIMITISRGLSERPLGPRFASFSRRIAPLLVASLLAGCAAPAPRVVAPGPEAVIPGRIEATVVTIRPVPPATAQGSGAVLAAMGAPAGQTDGSAEFILRTDQGEVLSIVQPGMVGLTPGARVVVLTSPRLQIVRPGFSAPTS